jgi:hypothetical protein
MTLKQATEIIQHYQDYRTCKTDEIIYTIAAITEALDMLIEHANK